MNNTASIARSDIEGWDYEMTAGTVEPAAYEPPTLAAVAAAPVASSEDAAVAPDSDDEHDEINRESWERLLAVFGSLPGASAARSYQRVHARLVSFFVSRGAIDPEELADATMDRVARKLSRTPNLELQRPEKYLLAVARRIWQETVKLEISRRRKLDSHRASELVAADDPRSEQSISLLERCLTELKPDERTLLLTYYEGRGQQRIDRRQSLVNQLGLTSSLLRTRVFRLRAQLNLRMSHLEHE